MHIKLYQTELRAQHKHVPGLEHQSDLRRPPHAWIVILPDSLSLNYIFPLFCVYLMDVINRTECQYPPVTFQKLLCMLPFPPKDSRLVKKFKIQQRKWMTKGLCALQELTQFDRTHWPKHQMSAAPIIMRQNIIVCLRWNRSKESNMAKSPPASSRSGCN